MKKLITAFALAFLLPLQALSVEVWQEDRHFKVIADNATAKPEVLEFFSYWCPACFNLEPLIPQIKQKLAADVSFKKVHVNFMGFTTPDIQDDVTKAMLIGRALKQEEKVNKAMFDHIHVGKNSRKGTISGLEDLRAIFMNVGIAADKFDKMEKSFGVNSLFAKNNKTISKFRSSLKSVPTFIINGKYMPTFTRDMGPDDMVDLVVWLSQQK